MTPSLSIPNQSLCVTYGLFLRFYTVPADRTRSNRVLFNRRLRIRSIRTIFVIVSGRHRENATVTIVYDVHDERAAPKTTARRPVAVIAVVVERFFPRVP